MLNKKNSANLEQKPQELPPPLTGQEDNTVTWPLPPFNTFLIGVIIGTIGTVLGLIVGLLLLFIL